LDQILYAQLAAERAERERQAEESQRQMQYLHEAYQKQLDAMQETNNQQMAAML
jgi:hypothetical protein